MASASTRGTFGFVAASLLLAACGTSGSSTGSAAAANSSTATPVSSAALAETSPTAQQAGSAAESCAKYPAAMVGGALGMKLAAPEETVNSSIVLCRYKPASGVKNALIRFSTQSDAATFAAGKKGFTTGMGASMKLKISNVPGFVDEAYTNTLTAGMGIKTTTLVARSGSLEVLVSADATLTQEKTLLTEILLLFRSSLILTSRSSACLIASTICCPPVIDLPSIESSLSSFSIPALEAVDGSATPSTDAGAPCMNDQRAPR